MRSLIFIFAIISSSSIMAAESLELDLSRSTLMEQKQLILKTIRSDAKYSEITASDRDAVEKALTQISEIMGGNQTISPLDTSSRQKVEAHQLEVNQILLKAYRDSRLICTRETAVGSNLVKRVCRTVAAKERDAEAARKSGVLDGKAPASGGSEIK